MPYIDPTNIPANPAYQPATSGGASPEEQQQQDKLQQQATSMGLPTPNDQEGVVTSEQLLSMMRQAGIDTDNPEVQALVTAVGSGLDVSMAQVWVTMLAADPKYQKAGVTTPYAQALETSGFGTDAMFPTAPGAAQLGAFEQMPTSAVGPQTMTQPDTGWVLFKNGVLVDKSNPEPMSAVIFKPNSQAPGSSWWYDKIQSSWSEEDVAKWRKRLVELGYLDKDYEKTKGFDEIFRRSLTEFHIYRYYNGGKAVPFDASAAGGGVHPTLTAKDFAEQTRNNVRQQFLAVFGDEPSSAELESWTQFAIRQAVQLQRKYMRRGVDESTALSAARTESAEAVTSKLWEDPIASFQRQSTEENTQLHDALSRAVAATEGLLG